MKTIVPDYYSSFACLMGACRHTCCVGWEIDIDEDTLEYYRGIPGTTGEKLTRCIDDSEDTACFRLTQEERCPFLTEKGLCELILTLGENSLCQICADHPRFRNFFTDRIEMGLGLCCEAAARLILTHSAPMHLTVLEDNGIDEDLTQEEAEILALRDEILGILQNRSVPIARRVQQMLEQMNIPSAPVDFAAWAKLLLSLERLDEEWTRCLKALLSCAEAEINDSPLDAPEWETAFEQLMVYLIYRHVGSSFSADDVENEINFCVLMWTMIRRLFLLAGASDMNQLVELVRLYSSEIEYSDENLAALHDALA